jgi:hypothetical protein
LLSRILANGETFALEHKMTHGFALQPPNGWRYLLVGGTRECYFAGTHFKPRKLPENAQSPTSQVHVLLGAGTLTSETPWNCQHEAFAAQREAGFHDWKACLT